jgi:branched-subunit amino acid ABC-type transport system permease component
MKLDSDRHDWDPLPDSIKTAAGIAAFAMVILLVAKGRAAWYYSAWDRWIVPHLTEETSFLEDWRAQAIAVFPLVFIVLVGPCYKIIWKTRIGLMLRHQDRAAEMMKEVDKRRRLGRPGRERSHRSASVDPGEAVRRFGKD